MCMQLFIAGRKCKLTAVVNYEIALLLRRQPKLLLGSSKFTAEVDLIHANPQPYQGLKMRSFWIAHTGCNVAGKSWVIITVTVKSEWRLMHSGQLYKTDAWCKALRVRYEQFNYKAQWINTMSSARLRLILVANASPCSPIFPICSISILKVVVRLSLLHASLCLTSQFHPLL